MNDLVLIALVVLAVLLVLGVVAWLAGRKRRSSALRDRFGPEYDRTVERSERRRDAERSLQERAEKRDRLDVRPLDPQRRAAYAEQWREAQSTFVDAPGQAVREADVLVGRVLHERGYPVGDFAQQADVVSVDHADVVEQYRVAHRISGANDRGEATTEQLRQAMVHYRALFSELLDERDDAAYPQDAPERDRAEVRRER